MDALVLLLLMAAIMYCFELADAVIERIRPRREPTAVDRLVDRVIDEI